MGIAGLLFTLGGVILFIVVPAFAIAGAWRSLEPGTRRTLVVLYLALLALLGLLGWMVDRWASSNPL